MTNIAIQADHVGKKFSKDLAHVMRYGAADILRSIVGIHPNNHVLRKGEFWAVKDVSFEVRRGESLGIIGPNGSGKTTLLKMLNGIFMPDAGSITIRGRVGSLIQVGAGFHPMLTGRENVYINGAILGMSKKEIDRKFDSIVEFADIGDFLDAPVRHYSSGMFVRLGFAIAIHCEPDVLLIDEILAVGDVNFRKKCSRKMRELKESDVTIVFVTHDLGLLRHICQRAVCLKSGMVQYVGDLDGAISEYMTTPFAQPDNTSPSTAHKIKQVSLFNRNHEQTDVVTTGEMCGFEVQLDMPDSVDRPVVGLAIYDFTAQVVIGLNTRSSECAIDRLSGRHAVRVEFPFLNLIPGTYSVRVALYDASMGMLDDVPNAMFFSVHSKQYSTGTLFSQHTWHIE